MDSELLEQTMAATADELRRVQALNAELLAALKSVKQCCLFADDNEQIGVTEDPHLPAKLFGEICALLKKAESQ